VLDPRQPCRESFQLLRVRLGINGRRGEIAFQPRQDLAVQAAAVLTCAFLEPGMEILRNVLEGQRERGFLLEPKWNRRRLARCPRPVNPVNFWAPACSERLSVNSGTWRRVGQYDEEVLAVGIVRRAGGKEQRRSPVRHEQAHSVAKSLSIPRSCSIPAAGACVPRPEFGREP
jgi:hypothetical protein